jgi:hypothetical protein
MEQVLVSGACKAGIAFMARSVSRATRGVEISESDLAKRILDQAADGIFHVRELKRAALEGLV